jgi:hypothetical protein
MPSNRVPVTCTQRDSASCFPFLVVMMVDSISQAPKHTVLQSEQAADAVSHHYHQEHQNGGFGVGSPGELLQH